MARSDCFKKALQSPHFTKGMQKAIEDRMARFPADDDSQQTQAALNHIKGLRKTNASQLEKARDASASIDAKISKLPPKDDAEAEVLEGKDRRDSRSDLKSGKIITSQSALERTVRDTSGSPDVKALRERIKGESDYYREETMELSDVRITDEDLEGVDPAKAQSDKGAILVGRSGEVIDGRHRVAAARKRGDTTILAFRPIDVPIKTEPKTETSPTEAAKPKTETETETETKTEPKTETEPKAETGPVDLKGSPNPSETVASADSETKTAFNEIIEATKDLPSDQAAAVNSALLGESIPEIAENLDKTTKEVQMLLNEGGAELSKVVGDSARGLLLATPAGGTTSTMNKVMEAERAARGEKATLKAAAQSHPEVMALAADAFNADPEAGQNLVDEILRGSNPVISEVQEAVLLIEKVDLANRRRQEQEAIFKAGEADNVDSGKLTAMQKDAEHQLELIERDMNKVDLATRKQGSVWGRFGRFRQTLAKADYSLESMETQARFAKKKELTKEELAEIEDIFKRREEIQKKIESDEGGAEERAADKAYQVELRAAGDAAGYMSNPAVVRIAEKLAKRYEVDAGAAMKRLRVKMGRTNLGLDLTMLHDLALVGRYVIARGVASSADFSVKMIRKLKGTISKGDLEPHLEGVYEEAKRLDELALDEASPKGEKPKVKKALTASGTKEDLVKIEERISERAEGGAELSEMRPLVRRLFHSLVKGGGRGRDALLARVHETLQESFPDITKSQTRDLISGYGIHKPLDPDETKSLIRDYVGEMQQLGKLESLQNKKAPKRTGVSKRETNKEERRIKRLVNQLKKKGDYVHENPTEELESTLDSMKHRLRNEMEDMEDALRTGTRIVMNKIEIITDKELESIRKERDIKREEYKTAFPKKPLSEEEQVARVIKGLDRTINQLTEDLAEGKLYPDSKSKSITSAEIRSKKAARDALIADRNHLRSLDTQTLEFKKEESLRKRIEKALKDDAPKKGATATVESEAVTKLREQLESILKAKEDSFEMRAARAEASVDAAILKVEEQIKSGEVKSPTAKEPVSTAELDRKRKILKGLREQRDALLGPNLETEETKLKRIQKSLDMMDLPPKGQSQKAPRPDSEEVAKLREELADKRRARRADPVHRLIRHRKDITRRTARLQKRIDDKDFLNRKPKPISLDEGGLALQENLHKVNKEFLKLRHNLEMEGRNLLQKGWANVIQLTTTTRAIQTSYDLSGFGRQGALELYSHPVLGAKALFKSVKAFVSSKGNREVWLELKERRNFPLYKDLFLVDPDEYSLSKLEEDYMSRWVDVASDFKPFKDKDGAANWAFRNTFGLGFRSVRASGRAYVSMLNVLRANVLDGMIEADRKSGTLDEGKTALQANFINVATGRGHAIGGGKGGVNANAVFFSPRLVASRFEYILGFPLWWSVFEELKSGDLGWNSASRRIATEYLRTAATTSTLVLLASIAGAEIEKDPRSSDFMKLKWGNQRIDIFGGLLQVFVVAARLFSGSTKTIAGDDGKFKIKRLRGPDKDSFENWVTVFSRFVRSKLNPAMGSLVNLGAGETVVGDETDLGKELLGSVTPMVFGDAIDTFKDDDLPAAQKVLGAFAAVMGVGVGNFDVDAKREEREAKKEAEKALEPKMTPREKRAKAARKRKEEPEMAPREKRAKAARKRKGSQ